MLGMAELLENQLSANFVEKLALKLGPKSKCDLTKNMERHQITGTIGVFSDRAEI